MTRTKSLLTVISALALATGTAFAGGGSQWQSTGPETDEALSLSLAEPGVINDSDSMSELDRLALSEPDMIYEESTAFASSVDNETPLG